MRRAGLRTTSVLTIISILIGFGTFPARAQSGGGGNDGVIIGYGVFLIIGVFIYFIPAIVAFRRKHPNRWVILIINLIFGGTGLGWLGSLVWAMNAIHNSDTGTQGGESGLNVFANDPVTVRIENNEKRPGTDDADEQLLRLKRLHEAGAIDDEEFQAMRRPVIEGIMKGSSNGR